MVRPAQSVLLPRLLTVISAVALLSAFFLLVSQIHGLIIAALATTMIIASPGFIELASSCMLEIPALAVGMLGLCASTLSRKIGPLLSGATAGACFGTALMIKFSPALLIPIAAFLISSDSAALAPSQGSAGRRGIVVRSIVVLVAATALAFVILDFLIDRGAYLQHFQQSWSSHFAPAKSFEYG